MKAIIDLIESIGVEHEGESKDVKRIVLTSVLDVEQKGSDFFNIAHSNGSFVIRKSLVKSLQFINK